MTASRKDLGIAQVLLQHLNEQLLPYALQLKDRVNKGESLTYYDQEFLKEATEEAHIVRPLLERQPQFKPLAHQVFALLDEITAKALENEKANAQKG